MERERVWVRGAYREGERVGERGLQRERVREREWVRRVCR